MKCTCVINTSTESLLKDQELYFFSPPIPPKQFRDLNFIRLVLNVREETEILLVNLKYVLTVCLVSISSYM